MKAIDFPWLRASLGRLSWPGTLLRDISERRVVNTATCQKNRAREGSSNDGRRKEFLALMELQVTDVQRCRGVVRRGRESGSGEK